jgi:two-component system, chemotaxis family, CheB/CheR fusion protein
MENEKQYGKTIQRLPDAVYVCDASGYVKLFNKAAAELWGREPQIGKDLYCGSLKILSADGTFLPLEKYPAARLLKEHQPVSNAEILIQRPDGSVRLVRHTSEPVYDKFGELDGAVNMQVEITGT